MRIAEPAFWPACVFNEKTTEFFYGSFNQTFALEVKPSQELWNASYVFCPMNGGKSKEIRCLSFREGSLSSWANAITQRIQFSSFGCALRGIVSKVFRMLQSVEVGARPSELSLDYDLFIISLFEKDVVLSTRRLRGRCRADPHRSCQSVRRLVAGGTEEPQISDGVAMCSHKDQNMRSWDEHWLVGSSHVTKKGVIVSKVTKAILSWDFFVFAWLVPVLLLASSCQVYYTLCTSFDFSPFC